MLQVIDQSQPAAMGLEELVRQFQVQQKRIELSPETIRTYVSPLQQFTAWMALRGITRTEQLTRELLTAWQESLKGREIDVGKRNARGSLAPATRSIYSISIRQLLRFAASLELIDIRLTLALVRVKVHRGLPRPIPADDLTKIAAYLERASERRKLTGLRTRALFWYLVSTGARISEALQVTRQDAARAVGTSSVTSTVRRKGGAQGLLTCPPVVTAMIRDYLEVRHDRSPWLFVNHADGGWHYLSGEPPVQLTAQAANQAWTHVSKRARIEPFTSHACRHTYATAELAAGTSHMAIADAMGHKDLRQMTTYAKVDEAHRQAGVDVMDDLVKHHRPPKTPRIWPAPTDAAAPRRASADLSADQRPSKPVMETPLEDLTGLQPWSDVAGAL
jgi:site-specific recombinase XerD